MQPKLVLASTSPRRQSLLEQINLPFTIRTANIDEGIIKDTNPIEKVQKLAQLKGKALPIEENEVVLAADTIVSYKGTIFEKPENKDHARRMIKTLSGQTHQVYTGVYMKGPDKELLFAEKTDVTFWELTDLEIEDYIQLEDPYDKAGAYGIQSAGAILVKHIFGDYYNVVGLPLAKVARHLRSFDIYPK